MSIPAIRSPSPLDLFFRNAQRRYLLASLMQQLPFVLGSLLAVLALILLLGTQWLPAIGWLLFGVAVFVYVLLRLRRDRLSSYKLAQTLDERLGASDALGTAWFVLHGDRTVSPAASSIQLAGAERIARAANLRTLLPLESRPKRWIGAAALCVIVLGLLETRYLLVHSHRSALGSLRAPIRSLLTPNTTPQALKPKQREADPERVPAWQDALNGPVPPAMTAKNNLGQTQTAALPGAADSPQNQSDSAQAGEANGRTDDANPSSSNRLQGANGNGQGRDERSATQNGASSPQSKEGTENHASDARIPNSNSDEDGKGALTRMKDALSSLLAKLGAGNNEASSKNSSNRKQSQSGENGSQNSTEQAENGKKEGTAQSTSEQNQGERSDGASGEPMEAGSSKSQAAPNGSSDTANANRNGDQQEGAGHQDGSKSLHEAEQLKALGKLQEIMGKRDQQVTGEMSVETSSGTQHLQTEYSGKIAHHKDFGGVIHNEAVPPEFQNYVKEYMTHVHDEANRAR